MVYNAPSMMLAKHILIYCYASTKFNDRGNSGKFDGDDKIWNLSHLINGVYEDIGTRSRYLYK